MLIVWSAFRVNRRIFPLGAWMASLAGFSRGARGIEGSALLPLTEEPATDETMDMALVGRMNGLGEVGRPSKLPVWPCEAPS